MYSQSIFNKDVKTILWKKSLFNQWYKGNWITTNKGKNMDTLLHNIYKNEFKMNQNINTRGEIIKLLTENRGTRSSWPWIQQGFLRCDTRSKGHKRKNQINQTTSKYKLLGCKGYHLESEKTTQRMGENVSKSCIW